MIPSLQTRLAILNKWQSGATQKQLAAEYGLSESRICQICQDTKIKINSAKRKVHYLHPLIKSQACGMGGDSLSLELTDDINQVTCRHCLNTIAGKKRSGGKEPIGSEPKVSITLRIDRQLRDRAKAKNLNFSQLLERALRKLT